MVGNMKKIYCISGLGADHRFFTRLAIPGYTLVPVPWVPHSEDDTLATYAMKMYASIPEEAPTIIGLSFGGMLATEIRKKVPQARVLLVSSAKTKSELGYDSALLRWLSRAEVIPAAWFVNPNPFILFMLGAETEEEKATFRTMLIAGDPVFVKWCAHAILHWENETIPQGIFQVHGTADRVIRPGNIHPDKWVEEGSHIMIYNRPEEVAQALSDHLEITI